MQNLNSRIQYHSQDNRENRTEKAVINSDVTKAAYVMADQDDMIDKLLRQPRSKKYMKAMKEIDLPSLTDLEIMERMKNKSEQRGEELVEADITHEDIEEFARRCLEEVKADIIKEKQEEERRLQEENILLMILSGCAIEGCVIHAIDHRGEILEHYRSVDQLSKQGKLGYQMYMEKNCSCVEVYQRRLVAIGNGGNVIEIRRLSDEDIN